MGNFFHGWAENVGELIALLPACSCFAKAYVSIAAPARLTVLSIQLRSSFKQAFGKKKSPKSASSHSDIEEMTDSSLPSSPKLPHNGSTGSTPLLRNSHSNSL